MSRQIRRTTEELQLERLSVAQTFNNPRNQAIIRARIKRFGPQTSLSLARALGLNTTRMQGGELSYNRNFARQVEQVLDDLLEDLGLGKAPSRNDPNIVAYHLVAVQEVG